MEKVRETRGGMKMGVVVETRCAMCGKKYQVDKEHPDFKKLEANPSVTFICDICNHRVRYESEEKQKEPKPM